MTQRRRASKRRARHRPRIGSALLLAALSAILPGLGHLRGGRHLTGSLLLAAFLSASAGIAGLVVWRGDELLELAVRPGSLMVVAIAAMALGAAWAAIVLHSYLVLRPTDLSPGQRAAGRAGVTALCLAVCVPFLLTAHYASVQHDLVTNVFSGSTRPSADAESQAWEQFDRVNILLLGSDAAEGRYGVRTDSIHLASIDTRTGRTVLISLPRNLEDVPFPPGPLRRQFPNGFDGLLTEVYQFAVEHPRMAPPGPRPGAELVKRVVGQVVGIPVHYYAMVDLGGFQKMVDAMGGVYLCVERDIPYGYRGKVVEAGCRTLTGSEALWYGRSRTLSSDYDRMKRQRCLIDAMVDQASPVTVLSRYRNMASAVKQIVTTDVPQYLLPDLLSLGLRVKKAGITSLQLVPPLISPAYPDYPRIRHLVQQAIQHSKRAGNTPDRRAKPSTRPSLVQAPMPPPGQGPAAGAQSGPQRPGAQRPGAQQPGAQQPGAQQRGAQQRGAQQRGGQQTGPGQQGLPKPAQQGCG